MTQGYFIEDIEIGMTAELTTTVSQEDVAKFAQITGDNNPVHLDQDYASTTMFKGCIAHGILTSGYISAIFGTKLPGPGAIYMAQNLKFMAPVPVGSEVTARVEVLEINKNRVKFSTKCFIGDKEVLDGDALIMVPSKNK